MSSRHHILAALAASCAMVVLVAAEAAAGFTTAIVLRTGAPHVIVRGGDLAANGAALAVGWNEINTGSPLNGGPGYLRYSSDGGSSWAPRVRVATNKTQDLRLDVCAGWVWSAFEVHLPSDGNVRFSAAMYGHSLTTADTFYGPLAFAGTNGNTDSADIACLGNRRAIAGWIQQVGTGAPRVWVQVDSLPSMASGPDFGPSDLDTTNPGEGAGTGMAVAAAAPSAYAAYFHAGHFKLARFSMGGAPDYAVSALSTTSFASDGRMPKLAASGSTVAVAYAVGDDTWVRVSTDHGATFAAPHRLYHVLNPGVEGSWPTSIDVQGNRIVVEVDWQTNGPGDETAYRFASLDVGGHWSRTTVGRQGTRLAAFAMISGQAKLCEAWDESIVPDYSLRQHLRFHRET